LFVTLPVLAQDTEEEARRAREATRQARVVDKVAQTSLDKAVLDSLGQVTFDQVLKDPIT